MRTLTRLAALVAVQAAFVGAAVAPQLSARTTGDTYQFRVATLDPIDPARGAYVTLDYPDLGLHGTDGMEARPDAEQGPIYVSLRHVGAVWVADQPSRDRPSGGVPYLACNDQIYYIKCGIESFFLSQDEAARVGDLVHDGAIAEVRIDGRGHAAVVDVRAP